MSRLTDTLPPDDWDESKFRADAHHHIGGRKKLPEHQKRKRRVLWLTDAEWTKAAKAVEQITGRPLE